MPRPAPYPVELADEITRQLDRLADHLTQLSAAQATQVIAHVLDPDAGVLAGITHLVTTGSAFAKDQAEQGALPAEVWLALGRASHDLYDISLDLDEHRAALKRVGAQPPTATAQPPAPVPLVVRRHR